MKKFLLIIIVFFISCNGKKELETSKELNNKNKVIKIDTIKTYSDTDIESLSQRSILLNNHLISMIPYIEEENALNFSHMNIDESEFEEIKKFSIDNLNKYTKSKTIEYVNNWLFNNVTYYEQNKFGVIKGIAKGRSINDPYETFKHRKAICYGFSNLMKVILNSLDIPAVVVSGWLIDIGNTKYAHSWIIAKGDKDWIVTDPTNNRFFGKINNDNSPHMRTLLPTTTDIRMFEDNNFSYDFSEGLNISNVKGNPTSITLPRSIYDLKITSFNPKNKLPNSLTSIKLSRNIIFLGEGAFGLNKYGNNLERISVENGNYKYSSYEGVLYKNDNKNPIYIPHKMTELILKPQSVYGKNVVINRNYITSITFPRGTERIKPYAVEHCPALIKVSVPESAIIEENAFYKENNSSVNIDRY